MQVDSPIEEGEVAKENVYFEMKVDASPIQVQKVGLFIKNDKGEIEDVYNTTPGPNTKVKWKTEKFENGVYTLWLEASIGKHMVKSKEFKN